MRHLSRSASLCAALLAAAVAPAAWGQTKVLPADQAQMQLSFASLVRQAAPAVVNIYATRVVQDRFSPFAGDPFFGQVFRDLDRGQPRLQNSLGSGVIVSRDGLVVSNYHVVGQATDIRVVLNDRREYSARVLLSDEDSDLAILQLDGARDLPALRFSDSDRVEVGDLVLAIGNPFGVGQTVSSGIVSGLARSALSIGGGRGYFIQTDAAINPGNSGGALVDMSGGLVGINTAILTKSGGSNGIGFAIPSNLVRRLMDQAKAGETAFQRPWAGMTAQAVDQGLAEALGLDRPEGVVITELHPDSPFATAGLRPRDVILALDGQRTNTPQEVLFRLAAIGTGQKVRVTYLSRGEEKEGGVILIAAPDRPPRQAVTITDPVIFQGLSVARINPAVQEEMDLPLTASGVVVTAVDGVAQRSGLQPGDILRGLNGQPVTSPADVRKLVQDPTRRWQIDILRGDRPLRLRFRF